MPELPNDQTHQACKRSHAEDHPEQIEAASGEDHCCTEEQAGFIAGRSTTEQIFNLGSLHEKYFQHQQDLYDVSIDFKKAFDRIWHAGVGNHEEVLMDLHWFCDCTAQSGILSIGSVSLIVL